MGSKMRHNVRARESVENDGSIQQDLCEANLPQHHYNLEEVTSITWCWDIQKICDTQFGPIAS